MPHQIEPELLVPPPRQIRFRRAALGNRIAAQLFLIPFTLIGLYLLALVLHDLALPAMGVPLNAKVVAIESKPDKAEGHTYLVKYNYTFAGTKYERASLLSPAEHTKLLAGSKLTVTVLSFLPQWDSALAIAGVPPGSAVWSILPFMLFWNGGMVLFYVPFYGRQIRSKKLVSTGSVLLGQVTGKVTAGGRTTYLLKYRYAPRDSHHDGKMLIAKSDYDRLQVGDNLTVLYDPEKPARSILYMAALHDAVS